MTFRHFPLFELNEMLSVVLSNSEILWFHKIFLPHQPVAVHSLSTNWIDGPLHKAPCRPLKNHDFSGSPEIPFPNPIVSLPEISNPLNVVSVILMELVHC